MTTLFLLVRLALAGTPADAVRAAVAIRLDVPIEEVEVSGIALPPGAPLEADWAVALPRTGPVTGDVPVAVRVGRTRYALVPHVVVWRPLPVAARATRPDEPVDVTIRRVSSERLGAAPVEFDGAWTARVALDAGEPLTAANVRPSPDAPRGARVKIVTGVGGVAVTAPGELLDDGWIGRPVTVLNLATRTVQAGTFRDTSVVILESP